MHSYLLLVSLLHESLLTLLLPALLLPSKVLWAGDLIHGLLIQSADIDFRRRSDDISGVHSSDGYAVDLEGTGYEQGAFLEMLEKDDSLAAEATGEEDEDGAGL